MTSENRAAWIPTPKQRLEVKEAPYPQLSERDVIIRNHAVAINPLEYKIQDTNPAIGGKSIEYPTILGADCAGTIVEIGKNVTRYKLGDRIIANTSSLGKQCAAFQSFVRVPEDHAVLLPDEMPFEKAVVLPLACDTAMAGLFAEDQLGMSTALLGGDGETVESASDKHVVLIWGGSSSVGCCAIQLARASGYVVYTTASSRNHDLCKSLGAARVFDHSHDSVEEEVVAAMQGKQVLGALDCIASGDKTIPSCVQILSKAVSGEKTKVVTVLTPPDDAGNDQVEVKRLSIPAFLNSSTYMTIHSWMARALASGSLQPKPDARVIGSGLESIQSGIDAVRKGVSATKVVVTLC